MIKNIKIQDLRMYDFSQNSVNWLGEYRQRRLPYSQRLRLGLETYKKTISYVGCSIGEYARVRFDRVTGE